LGRNIAQPDNPPLLIAVFPAGTHTHKARVRHEGHDRFITRFATLTATVHTVLKVLIALPPHNGSSSRFLAIKAEQHYIRVYSPDKEYMILYRFSDAVRELD
jgi:hypothetical protein